MGPLFELAAAGRYCRTMKLAPSLLLLSWLVSSPLACDSGSPTTKAAATPAPATPSPAAEATKKATAEPAPTPTPTPAVPVEAKPAEPTPAVDPNADVVLDEMKDYYGLKVAEVDGWTPSFEADAGGIQWDKPGHVQMSMALNAVPIEKVEDIESGFMAGATVAKQDPPTKTASGWYTVVTTDDGTQGFIYVRKIGKSSLVCDTLVSRGEGDDRPVVELEKLVEICDGATLP